MQEFFDMSQMLPVSFYSKFGATFLKAPCRCAALGNQNT